MGEITNKIFELLESGANIEEKRSREIIATSNRFKAVFGRVDRRSTAVVPTKAGSHIETGIERIAQKKSALAIQDIR